MTQPTELEKKIWEILDKTGMNPMLQPSTCDRILAAVNRFSKIRIIKDLPFCDDNSYGYDEHGLCLECGLEQKTTNIEITAKEYLKTVGKDDRIVNREDLPEFWVYISDLMEGYAQEKNKNLD